MLIIIYIIYDKSLYASNNIVFTSNIPIRYLS